MFTNGESKTITAQVITASIIASAKTGQYTLQLNPTAEVATVLPTGRINYSEAQLRQLAGKAGMNDYKTLLIALGKGGCTVTLSFEYCKAGETSPDNESVVYESDWWKADKISSIFDFGEAATNFIERIQMQVAGAAELEGSKTDRQQVIASRLALLLERNNKKTAPKAQGSGVKDDILGKTEDDGDDVDLKGAGKGKKATA